MRKWIGIFILSGFLLGGFFVAEPVEAQTCNCFCTSSQGAVSVGQKKQDECAAACPEGERPIVCAQKTSQYPGNTNARCFSQSLCDKQGGEWADFQAPDCPQEMRYCYPKPKPYTLGIAIGEKTTVENVGDYINTLYIFGLGAAVVVAILMLMIGGLQYALGAGSPSQIEKGKTRIKQAVIGLVLLLSASLILETVNPRLRRLQPPPLPMVRQVGLISDAADCQTLKENGYKVTEVTEKGAYPDVVVKKAAGGSEKVPGCGSIAEVVAKPDGTSLTATTCVYTACANAGDACFGSGANAQCLSCQEVVPGNDLNLKPSQEVCSSLALPSKLSKVPGKEGKYEERNYCMWTQDPNAFYTPAEAVTVTASLVAGLAFPPFAIVGTVYAGDTAKDVVLTGTCAEVNLNCSGIAKCEDYDNQDVKNDLMKSWIGTKDDELDDFEPGSFSGTQTIKTICEEDPCGVAGKDGICFAFDKRGTVPVLGVNIGSYDCVTVKKDEKWRDTLHSTYDVTAEFLEELADKISEE